MCVCVCACACVCVCTLMDPGFIPVAHCRRNGTAAEVTPRGCPSTWRVRYREKNRYDFSTRCNLSAGSGCARSLQSERERDSLRPNSVISGLILIISEHMRSRARNHSFFSRAGVRGTSGRT